MINATHWLGALATVVGTIGIKDTPERAMIHAAASRLQKPITLAAIVVTGHELAGIFIGDLFEAWSLAADFSAWRNIIWCEHPYQRILSSALAMYDELWTGAKAMYKMEPAVAVGGEVIIYAPHLDVVSHVHGRYIYEVGYHILPYFLDNWDRFKHIPLGVLAHSTHVRGSGVMENGIEKPNVRVTLASKISPGDCSQLNLGFLNPAKIDIEAWRKILHAIATCRLGMTWRPIPTINAAVESRLISALKSERVVAAKVLGSAGKFSGDKAALIDAAEQALYASKITSYAQGLSLLKMASLEYSWNMDISRIVPVWRVGCIIRAALLSDITHAYRRNPDLPNLLLDEAFTRAVLSRQAAWRTVVQTAVGLGIPMLATSASLAYFDAYRSAVLPANLTQALRDYFGAHTYRRVDRDGIFHTYERNSRCVCSFLSHLILKAK